MPIGAAVPFVGRLIMAVIVRFRALPMTEKTNLLINIGSGAGLVYQLLGQGNLKQDVYNIMVAEVAQNTGLQLDPKAPFSDASLSGALSQKTGIPIRSLKDRAMIEEDVEAFAVTRISAKLGYPISTIRDVETLKKEVAAISAAIVVERTG